MNLFEATLERDGEACFARFGPARLEISDGCQAASRSQIVLGLRPESLSYPAQAGQQVLRAEVETVEHLGAETLIEVSLGEVEAVAKLGRQDHLRPGAGIELGVAKDKILTFDARDGSRLRAPEAGQ